MLKFIIGTAGTGKSTRITERIVSLAKQGEKCLLIVPEQFSKTGESVLFSALDDTQSNLVELFSFTSLLRDVNTNHKKISASVLTAAGKAVMARRSVENVKKMLTHYSRQRSNFGFSFSLAQTFHDFRRSGISRDVLYTLAQDAPQRNGKLKELALIYSEYTGLMGDKFCDSEDLYVKLGEILPFYIVSFLGMYVFFSVSGIVDVKGRRRILKTHLIDYLENHMSNRLRAGTYEEGTHSTKAREKRSDIEIMPVHSETLSRRKNSMEGQCGDGGDVFGKNGALGSGNVAFGGNGNKNGEAGLSEEPGEERMAGQAAGLLNRIQEKELEELLKEFLAL